MAHSAESGPMRYKAFRYRVYPTSAQEARLLEWESALRFLWNLANEQRLLGLSRTDKCYPRAFEQINELTALRAELPWLAAVPRHVAAQLLVELDKAWQRYFKRLGGRPRWKRKGQGFLAMTEPAQKTWHLKGCALHFPKLGNLRTIVHRPLEGKRKTCTILREGDQWFACIVCELETDAPVARTGPAIAIDRGITYTLADSDGKLTKNPKHYEQSTKRLARAQRVVSRRVKGSKNREKAKLRVMRLHRKVRRQREHFLHVESARLAKSHGVIVIEKLNVAGMSRGNCSRGIAGAGWSKFADMLRYKLAWSGGSLIEVPAAYSSQTCSACGTVDAYSRKGERFCCTGCGLVNPCESLGSACGGTAARGLPSKQEREGEAARTAPPASQNLNPWSLS